MSDEANPTVKADQPFAAGSSPTRSDLERRVEQLESLLMHLQRDLQSLDESLLEHVTRTERQQRRVEQFLARLERLELHVDDHRDPEAEKPPHY